MLKRIVALTFLFLISSSPAWSQKIVDACNTQTLTVGNQSQFQFMDKKGNLCVGSTVGSTVAPSPTTIVTLDVKTVTTGGSAVAALAAGNRTAGGWLQNPSTATQPLCINEIGTASGTSSNGDTYCITPGNTTVLTGSANGVSVVSSDNNHPFAGYGYK